MQDDCAEKLPLAEFCANNQIKEFTHMSPFFTNYGLHPAAHFDIGSGSLEPLKLNVYATTLASLMSVISEFLRAEIGCD